MWGGAVTALVGTRCYVVVVRCLPILWYPGPSVRALMAVAPCLVSGRRSAGGGSVAVTIALLIASSLSSLSAAWAMFARATRKEQLMSRPRDVVLPCTDVQFGSARTRTCSPRSTCGRHGTGRSAGAKARFDVDLATHTRVLRQGWSRRSRTSSSVSCNSTVSYRRHVACVVPATCTRFAQRRFIPISDEGIGPQSCGRDDDKAQGHVLFSTSSVISIPFASSLRLLGPLSTTSKC